MAAMKSVGRKSIRLKGFDYSQAGEYFVTICTKNRACILGEIIDGEMKLSRIGGIVDSCWKKIPGHFENTRVSVFQAMPSHVHGVIEIKEKMRASGNIRRGVQLNARTGNRFSEMSPEKDTLGVIVRTFKGAVTTELRKRGWRRDSIWQRNYHDHIIRSDLDHFFIQRYIELNPLLWHLDSDNPDVHRVPIDEMKRTLRDRHGLDHHSITYLIDCETEYREWQEAEGVAENSPGIRRRLITSRTESLPARKT